MKKISILLLGLILLQCSNAHYKARYHVIVDTDGGMDDFRAICMMLASPEIEVIAVTAADGVLPPEETARKLSSLFHRFGHEGIPFGIGESSSSGTVLPSHIREMARNISWGKESGADVSSLPGASSLIRNAIEMEEMPVDIIVLGPMTNLAEVLAETPRLDTLIRRTYWYAEDMQEDALNYRMDPEAAGLVENSKLPMDRIHSGGIGIADLQNFTASLDTVRSQYAEAVLELYASGNGRAAHHRMSSMLSDDCVPLYLTHPSYFKVRRLSREPEKNEVIAVKSDSLRAAIPAILDGNREDKSIIFSLFPVNPELFEEDVSVMAEQIIDRHGLKEWKIVVLTNEFHEHLGIYSIIGAKMGLRAREFFNLGIDELTIESLAGSQPPVSCMNDGLQVSTGATLGHGTIFISNPGSRPAARFRFKNHTVEISLKKDIRQQIRSDVQKGVQRYGLDSPEYWTYIRGLALNYWLELDRRKIFDIISQDSFNAPTAAAVSFPRD